MAFSSGDDISYQAIRGKEILIVAGPFNTITEKLDAIKHLTAKGVEYWHARELMPVLGYDKWSNFHGAIEQAKIAFDAAGEDASNHFSDTGKMVTIGSGAERIIDDYYLSRPACYIIVMNADSSKPEIAEGQKYFAIQTRRMEKIDRLIVAQRRVALRNRIKDRNSRLTSTAQQAGVRQFALFHGAGIFALYKMRLTELKAKRGIGGNEDWLDRQGVEELAANEFRITQTDAKIRREGITGEEPAIRAHAKVAGEVREAIRRSGNTMPENLPQEPSIKEIEVSSRRNYHPQRQIRLNYFSSAPWRPSSQPVSVRLVKASAL
jgi:DNA-damage-inducible protein D